MSTPQSLLSYRVSYVIESLRKQIAECEATMKEKIRMSETLQRIEEAVRESEKP
jgi:hypothetical protein